jgi:hypothetical protein
MSNMQIKLNHQINAKTGPRAHPNHLAALAEAKQRPRVRVEPVDEAHRHVLRHPNGPAFRAEGSAEWPLDRFTHRRLRDGSIKIVERIEQGQRQQEKPGAAKGERQTRAPESQQARPAERQEKQEQKQENPDNA